MLLGGRRSMFEMCGGKLMKVLGWYSFIVLNLIIYSCIKDYCNDNKISNLEAIILIAPIAAYVIHTLMKL